MHENELVNDLPSIKDSKVVCTVCQFGKQSRLPFGDSTWRATDQLQLIHSDVCGPMSTLSLNGSRYFLLFIDDYSRMCWVYFMKEKSEVFCIFKRFKQLVEKQVDKQIKILRTDNGGEFTSREFNSFCEIEGIQRQLTVPCSP